MHSLVGMHSLKCILKIIEPNTILQVTSYTLFYDIGIKYHLCLIESIGRTTWYGSNFFYLISKKCMWVRGHVRVWWGKKKGLNKLFLIFLMK
jgi:hypothetical protein